MTWAEITLADRSKLGSEFIPADQIKPPVPPKFSDRERFLVLRYHGSLPMVGVRSEDTFHILWIEKVHGEVYDHE